jgi:hypothetical protein
VKWHDAKSTSFGVGASGLGQFSRTHPDFEYVFLRVLLSERILTADREEHQQPDQVKIISTKDRHSNDLRP